MNLLKLQNQLRSVPDDALVNYVQNPQPNVPSYLALSELQRRQDMREKYQAQSQQPESSVAEDVVGKEQQGGLAAMMGGMQQPQQPQQPAPQMPEQTMMAQAPMQQPTMMAEGGLASLPVDDDLYPEEFAGGGMVAFAGGGDVPGYAAGTYLPPVSYDPTAQYSTAREYEMGRRLRDKYNPTPKSILGDVDLLDIVGQETKRREEAAGAGIVSPYDAAIKYYGENTPEGQKLLMRRSAWLAGRPDPFTGAAPVGSATNVRGEAEPGGRPVVKQEPKVEKEKAKPVVAPRIDVPEVATPEAPKERSLAEYAKELQDFLGPDTAREGQEARIAKMESEAQRQRDIAPWMALTEAGLATAAGSSPFALQNIGAGALMGVKSYGAAQKDYQSQLEKLHSLRNDMAKLDRSEKIAAAKFGADSREAERDRAAKAALQVQHDKILIKIQEMDNAAKLQAANIAASVRENKPISMSERLKMREDINLAMQAEEQNILKDLGSNAKNPSSKAYPNYVKRMNQAKQRVIADVMSGGTAMMEEPAAQQSSGIKFLGWE